MADADAQAGPASQLRVLGTGDLTFGRMLAAIDQAKREVHLEVYTFQHDRIGGEFIKALTAAAGRGVKVSVLVDAWGTDDAGRLTAELAKGGCETKVFNPLLEGFLGRVQRNHRKLLVVDDDIGFIGGVNISDAFSGPAGWANLSLELTGEGAAALARQVRRGKQTANLPDMRIILSSAGARALRRRYLKALGQAKSRIFMAHSYFLPDRRLLRSIRAAALRGVEVSLLLPSKSDVPGTHALTRLYYKGLLKAGAHIYEWGPSVLHAKVAAIDGEIALIGSFNLDPWSFVNLETLAEVHRPDIAAEIEGSITAPIAGSLLAEPGVPGRFDGPLEALGRSFLSVSWSTSRAVSKLTRGLRK